MVSLILLIISLPLAYWLAFSRWKGKFLAEAVVSLPIVLPPTVLGFYLLVALGPSSPIGRWYQALTGSGLAFTFSGLVIGSVIYSLPFCVQPMTTAFASVDHELLDASAILGASRWRTFWRIILPLSFPGVVTGFVLSFAHTLGEFGVVLMIGGNIPGATQTVSILIYDQVQALNYSRRQYNRSLAAGAVPVVALAPLRAAPAQPLVSLGVALSGREEVNGADSLRARIRKRFGNAEPPSFQVDVEFEAPAGVTILFGASGAGKTTILHCIAGLQKPNEGSISVGSVALFDSVGGLNLPPNRRQVGYLFQTLALFPHMSVEQNVRYGLATLSSEEQDSRVSDVLNSFRIAGLARRRPGEISGGERQRVALARTLVTRPRGLLLDEPLTALDAVTKARIVEDLRAWNQRFRIPILYVTHDRTEVFALAEQMLVLSKGRIIAQGLPQDVLHRPEMESVAQLAGFENVFDCAVVERHTEQGTMACRIVGSQVDLEVPLTRANPEQPLSVGIRAGDILVSVVSPQGLSARNVIAGAITSLEQRDVMVIARVDCGAVFEVHLTPGAVRALQLAAGSRVWLVIKTYSCLVLQGSAGSEA